MAWSQPDQAPQRAEGVDLLGRSSGASSAHSSWASRHLGWKLQPVGDLGWAGRFAVQDARATRRPGTALSSASV